jgi:hypothetical protein
MKEEVYIVDGVRTPFGKSGTTLADTSAVELGKTHVRLVAGSGHCGGRELVAGRRRSRCLTDHECKGLAGNGHDVARPAD